MVQALGHGLVGEAVPRQLGDVLGHVAHALERRVDPKRAHDDAQVARDRLLTGEDVDGELVEFDRELVDAVVVGDDLFGHGDVGVAEGLRRLLDGDRDEFGDLDQAILDLSQ